MKSQATINQQSYTASTASPLIQNIVALGFGLVILFAVGFSPVESAHNAAHDTRHALAFPCH